MNQPELITKIAKDHNCTKAEAKRAIKYVTESIYDALANGEEVNLFGFGNFKYVQRAAKRYRHPVTGEMEEMPSARKIKFVPSTQLAKEVK